MSIDKRPRWVTKNGQRLIIAKMTDDHLCNVSKMLRRKGFVTLQEFDDAWGVAASFDSESMASYYSMGAVSDLKISKELEHIEEEIYKRKIKI